MLVTPSLEQQFEADRVRIETERVWSLQKLRERVWNTLIPASAIRATIIEGTGVCYLHPTKGYRYVSKKRFAVRGVY